MSEEFNQTFMFERSFITEAECQGLGTGQGGCCLYPFGIFVPLKLVGESENPTWKLSLRPVSGTCPSSLSQPQQWSSFSTLLSSTSKRCYVSFS